MIDIQKLKALAEAATPGRVHDRLDSCGGGLKYECFGDDGSLVLKVDHKNDEWGFVGDRGEQDEAFFLACTPAAVLELIAEIERLRREEKNDKIAYDAVLQRQNEIRAERDQLQAENEALRNSFGRYEWIKRRISKSQYAVLGAELTSHTIDGVDAAIDAAMSKEAQ